tara:strand:- start:1856 stop:2941 length:1086 start_codon:yes stop_codon:yes gene_type:complete
MPVPEELQKSWDEALQLIENGDPKRALEILRPAWEYAQNPQHRIRTIWYAADANVGLGEIDKGSQKRHWQEAYKNYSRALTIDPKNKETRRRMNKLASMMDEKSISLGLGFQMFDEGNPTPLGLMAMTVAVFLILASFKILFDRPEVNPIVLLEVVYTVNGNEIKGEIEIELYQDDAPLHVESFLSHVENFRYDFTEFHRIIDDFMIQGGDIEHKRGSGGYAAHYYGWCNGQEVPLEQCSLESWTIPYEHENGLRHTAGALAAAHAGLNTDGSQFYIVPEDAEPCHLDGDRDSIDTNGDNVPDSCIEAPEKDCSAAGKSCHTVFGYVISGIEHVNAMSEVSTDSSNAPSEPVRLLKATIMS